MSKSIGLFKSRKPIRLGIWGLGRGSSFYAAAKAIGFEIVAGCDFNQHMRDGFIRYNPDAWVTDDAKKFLAGDFDAVLLATFCPAHADDAIACLAAGKHVVSEVTSFHTMAEGVRLVEAVERAGKVYNLAENYPHTVANHWLARKWKDGVFGELQYAEYEYVHECRPLAYTYIDGQPINPGYQAHSWRSWLSGHYYNTHSFGPVMHITGLRPTKVTALPSGQSLAGYPSSGTPGLGGISSSLIHMNNGAVVRNLMGSTTNDTHNQRLWGTRGSAETDGFNLQLRLGGSGHSPKLDVQPSWDALGDLARESGHGGGDFWTLYYFSREIYEGEPAPFDIYRAADCTIPGILAAKSATLGGTPQDVPDFRDKAIREAYRNDHWKQNRFDAQNGLFPKGHDTTLTSGFSLTMRDLISCSTTYRAYRDWSTVIDIVKAPDKVVAAAKKMQDSLIHAQTTYKVARQIADAYPGSTAARVLNEMLDLGGEAEVVKSDFANRVKKDVAALEKQAQRAILAFSTGENLKLDKFHSAFLTHWKTTRKLAKRPKGGVESAPFLKLELDKDWTPVPPDGSGSGFVNVHSIHGSLDGVAYSKSSVYLDAAGTYDLLVGHDGGVRVFVNGKAVYAESKRVNPGRPDRGCAAVQLKKGKNEIVVALDTDKGGGWGFFVRFGIPKDQRKGLKNPVFPQLLL